MTPLGILALGFGMWLWMGFDIAMRGWLLAKLAIVIALVIYHLYCGMLLDAFAAGHNEHSDRWFRWFNEVPVVLLLGAVVLVVVKPF
jgi:putative membrane protein